MKLVEDVYEIAESFMKDPKYVRINNGEIDLVSNDMKLVGTSTFPIPEEKKHLKAIILEIVAASINYCYWYGRSDIRPGGANSTLMYDLVVNSFFDFEYPTNEKFDECIERLIKALAIHRFPLLEERARHLRELKGYAISLGIEIETRYCVGYGNEDLTYFFTNMVENLQGFASDTFLKRASLFFRCRRLRCFRFAAFL